MDTIATQLPDVLKTWPMVGHNSKIGIVKKLRNARTDLRLILQSEQPVLKPEQKQELPEYAIATTPGHSLIYN